MKKCQSGIDACECRLSFIPLGSQRVSGSHCADVMCTDISALQFFPLIHLIYLLNNNYLFIYPSSKYCNNWPKYLIPFFLMMTQFRFIYSFLSQNIANTNPNLTQTQSYDETKWNSAENMTICRTHHVSVIRRDSFETQIDDSVSSMFWKECLFPQACYCRPLPQ